MPSLRVLLYKTKYRLVLLSVSLHELHQEFVQRILVRRTKLTPKPFELARVLVLMTKKPPGRGVHRDRVVLSEIRKWDRASVHRLWDETDDEPNPAARGERWSPACVEPGAVDDGTHIVFPARPDGTS